jgi:hypothetical protein
MAAPFDIHIQIVPASNYRGMRFYSFGQRRSLGVRGLQKLVNVFAKYALTPVGTDPLDPTYGTEIPNLFGSNVDLRDAQDVLLLSVDKTAQAIRGFQSSLDVPDDERLATATVNAVILIEAGPGIAAQIRIENVVRQGTQLLLPTLTVRT